MSDSKELFGKTAEDLQAGAVLPGTGILPYQQIRALIRDHEIWSEVDILPGEGATVAQKIQQFALHEIDLTKSAVLEKDCVYVVPLLERLQLSSRIAAAANPKSSTGRLDIFTRLITDRGRAFDEVPVGYQGPLYAEIVPRTFSVILRQGSRLSQIRFRRGSAGSSAANLRRLQEQYRLVDDEHAVIRGDGIAVTLDLAGHGERGLVG